MSKDKARSWLQTSQAYSDFQVNLYVLDLILNFFSPLAYSSSKCIFSDNNEMNPTEYSNVFWKVDDNYIEAEEELLGCW